VILSDVHGTTPGRSCIGAYSILDISALTRCVYRRPVRSEDRLFRDLAAFFREHENCGELDGGVEGERVYPKSSAVTRPYDRRAISVGVRVILLRRLTRSGST
jgi:hypothetical protein